MIDTSSARIEVSPQRVAHLPGCSHKGDDDDYSRWGFITIPNAWDALATSVLTTDEGITIQVKKRCADCMTRAASGFTADGLPRIGVQFPRRTPIRAMWGGDINQGIVTFPTDPDLIVNIFSDEAGPYADRRIPGTDRIEYVGQGTEGDQTLTARGNGYLERARLQMEACRYWHKAIDGPFVFARWVVIVARRREWQRDTNGQWRRAYVYVLAPVGSPDPDEWTDAIRAEVAALAVDDEIADYPPDLDAIPITMSLGEVYRDLTARAAATPQTVTTTTSNRYSRSAHAREAVLLRSANTCENPSCGGMACDTTSDGHALLEVDHVHDLAEGGLDQPINMIALCPNCHSAKTRGANRIALRRRLTTVAADRHHELHGT